MSSSESYQSSWTVALAGNPNCGKTALFNSITGGRAKVGNYPGVTVERKESRVELPSGNSLKVVDLPGTYSLDARTPDEQVARDLLLGELKDEQRPDFLIGVADANQLERSLGLILELRALDQPMVLALNMMDLAQKRGLDLDLQVLSHELGIPVIPTIAPKKEGVSQLLSEVEHFLSHQQKTQNQKDSLSSSPQHSQVASTLSGIQQRFSEVDRILKLATRRKAGPTLWTDRVDQLVLHPILGSLIFFFIFGLMFQAIFSWAELPKEAIESGMQALSQWVGDQLSVGPLRSLLMDGIIAGVGSVLVFLPQILLLFLFILILEDSGYLPRAAFLMDKWMGKVGLHGRAFLPLLSSFACAIPGIMATRTIENRRDRLTTILIAPLMTCSARLPVYSLLIGAFIPNTRIIGPLHLQGLVMAALYFGGMAIALVMAVLFKKVFFRGEKPVFLMELPTYKWPNFKGIALGLLERAFLFIKKAGTVILSISILLWFLSSYPKAPAGSLEPAIASSYAGQIGHALEPWVKPIGLNWKIAVALIPGFAAREVMVGSLATVYAVEGQGQGSGEQLGQFLAHDWSLATALSLLVWYMLACQCLSTLAVTRRETNSWRWPAFMMIYLTVIAYAGSFFTYQIALKMGWG